jgi:general secretion pathway protein A
MYEKFFQLEKTPFSMTPDPDCVHLTSQHADAISGLVFGVLDRKGYLVLTAEAGLGKTTALVALSQLLTKAYFHSSLIFNPILSAPEFLEMVMLNFGFEQIPSSKAQRLNMLQNFLLGSDMGGKVSALIVDEAHKLSPELLEEVRLLGNFQAGDHKLLQIVLVGQTELNDRLNLPELWQLKQRIAIRLSLKRLDRQGVEEYVKFRWEKAGGTGPPPFAERALDGIAAWSNGIPRLINAICDNALLVAFSQATRAVDIQQVSLACAELDLPTPAITSRPEPSIPLGPALRPASKPLPASPPAPPKDADQLLTSLAWADSKPSLLKRWLRMSNLKNGS